MPQYEIETADGAALRIRARDLADAAARAGADAPSVSPEADVHGWHEVASGGEPWGRVREHHRMRFRRD